MPRLFHYTCAHSVPGIAADMVVIPHRQPMLGVGVALSWWTTAANPIPAALGLAGHSLVKCDRMQYRFMSSSPDIVPWSQVRDDYPTAPLLEAARGTRPALWWVAFTPVSVEPAPRHQGRMP